MKTSDARSSSVNLSCKDRASLFLEREGNRRLRSLSTVLSRLTAGSFTPRDRDLLLLTTLRQYPGRQASCSPAPASRCLAPSLL